MHFNIVLLGPFKQDTVLQSYTIIKIITLLNNLLWHCSGNLVFVLGGSGYCHLSSLSSWQQRDKKCGRACWMQSLGSVAQGVSFTCEWEEEEGGGWTWCVFDKMHMLFICGGSMSRVSTHARSLQLLISTLTVKPSDRMQQQNNKWMFLRSGFSSVIQWSSASPSYVLVLFFTV